MATYTEDVTLPPTVPTAPATIDSLAPQEYVHRCVGQVPPAP